MSVSNVDGWSHLNPQKRNIGLKNLNLMDLFMIMNWQKFVDKCVRFPTVFSNYTYHALTDTKMG